MSDTAATAKYDPIVTDVESFVKDLEAAAKTQNIGTIEQVVVSLISLAALVVGIWRPDIKSELSAVPQSVIVGVSLFVLMGINAVVAHGKSSTKQAAIVASAHFRSALSAR